MEHVGTKKKKQHKKNNNIPWGNEAESTGERWKIKEISKKVKQYRQNRTF